MKTYILSAIVLFLSCASTPQQRNSGSLQSANHDLVEQLRKLKEAEGVEDKKILNLLTYLGDERIRELKQELRGELQKIVDLKCGRVCTQFGECWAMHRDEKFSSSGTIPEPETVNVSCSEEHVARHLAPEEQCKDGKLLTGVWKFQCQSFYGTSDRLFTELNVISGSRQHENYPILKERVHAGEDKENPDPKVTVSGDTVNVE